MKKIITLILILSLVLCGCGGSKEPAGQVTPQTEASATEAPQAEEKALSIGRIEGGVYTNEYIGIGCEMDENWSIYSAEELQQLPGNVQELMEGSDMAEAMESYPQIFDMQAENVNDLLSVNVVYTKVGMQERLMYATMSEEDVIDTVLAQSDMIIQSYEQAGMTIKTMEKIKVTFLGEEHFATYTEAESQGVPIYMVQLMNYHLGAYGVTMTCTSYMENNTQTILDMFYVVE